MGSYIISVLHGLLSTKHINTITKAFKELGSLLLGENIQIIRMHSPAGRVDFHFMASTFDGEKTIWVTSAMLGLVFLVFHKINQTKLNN